MQQQEPFAFLNDHFIREEKALIHARDLALQRGYAIFDYLRVKNNQVLFLDKHLDRFLYSAGEMRLPVKFSKKGLADILFTLVKKNDMPASGIRITLTGGISRDAYSIGEPQLVITQSLFSMPGDELFRKGISLLTYPHRRQLPRIKTIDYLLPIYLQPLLKEKAADDVLYEMDGLVSECPRANLFIVTPEKTILTPAKHVLHGITRDLLLTGHHPSMRIREADLTMADLRRASEVFITSTTKGILPVNRINDIEFETPGATTSQLREHFQAIR